MRKLFFTAILACSLVAPASAAPEPKDFLQPSAKWLVSYDDNSCDLIGQFGTGNDEIIVKFTRFGPSTGFKLTLFGEHVRRPDQTSVALVDFGPVENPRRTKSMNGLVSSRPMMDLGEQRLDDADAFVRYSDGLYRGPAITPDDEAKVETLTVRINGVRTIRLHLGSMAKPMLAMRTCTRNLLKTWGYDPDELASLRRPAMPAKESGRWITSADYPKGLIESGNNGIVYYRLDVDEKGAATACHVLGATRPANFAEITCRVLLQQSRLDPAINQAGKPVRSPYVGTVYWVIGDD